MSENNTKRCPFCGEEIKATAVKCKHCGEFFNTQNDKPRTISKSNGCLIGCLVSCAWVVGIFAMLIIICSFVLEDEISNYTSDNTPTEEVVNNYDTIPQKVTGDYSGFGKWAVMTANYGGQAANCQEKGVGISLVEQIENFFENISENSRPVFYHVKQQNPNLSFLVSNPVWAENMTFPNACKADVEFENIDSNTIMGYYNDEPYTVDDSYCKITYTVSEQGEKYRANVINMFCTPTYGYR